MYIHVQVCLVVMVPASTCHDSIPFCFIPMFPRFYSMQMEMDPSERSLVSAGACGAFVHGLEDEFMGNAHTLLLNELTPAHVAL